MCSPELICLGASLGPKDLDEFAVRNERFCWMRPSNLPTTETLSFVRKHLTAPPSQVLEVGCGNGELASRLQVLGYRVIALDSSVEAVRQTKALGVDARTGEWPNVNLEVESVDVILFTRSLHHIHPLQKALHQAERVLRPDGLVLIEDFAFDELSQPVLGWFYDVLKLLNASGRLELDQESFCRDLLLGGADPEIWRRHHDHDLHPWSLIISTLKIAFEPIIETSAAYLYRYLCPLLESSEGGHRIATRVLEMENELEMITPGRLIGRRFVGRKIPVEKDIQQDLSN